MVTSWTSRTLKVLSALAALAIVATFVLNPTHAQAPSGQFAFKKKGFMAKGGKFAAKAWKKKQKMKTKGKGKDGCPPWVKKALKQSAC